MPEQLIVHVEGGPAHGQAYRVDARPIDELPRRVEIDGAAYCRVTDIGEDGHIRVRYVVERVRRYRKSSVPNHALRFLRLPVLFVLRNGGTWADVEKATGVRYSRWLTERKLDPQFDRACRFERQCGRHL